MCHLAATITNRSSWKVLYTLIPDPSSLAKFKYMFRKLARTIIYQTRWTRLESGGLNDVITEPIIHLVPQFGPSTYVN